MTTPAEREPMTPERRAQILESSTNARRFPSLLDVADAHWHALACEDLLTELRRVEADRDALRKALEECRRLAEGHDLEIWHIANEALAGEPRE